MLRLFRVQNCQLYAENGLVLYFVFQLDDFTILLYILQVLDFLRADQKYQFFSVFNCVRSHCHWIGGEGGFAC